MRKKTQRTVITPKGVLQGDAGLARVGGTRDAGVAGSGSWESVGGKEQEEGRARKRTRGRQWCTCQRTK